VAVVGHLHSGKTSLVDLMLGVPHGTRYTDTRVDEQQRMCTLLSLCVEGAAVSLCCRCVVRALLSDTALRRGCLDPHDAGHRR
jgi:translation elongation factor EF-G